MSVKKALAYDTITRRWIGRVPVTWFDNFPHLSHTDKAGKRSHGARRRRVEAIPKAAPEVPTPEKEDGDAQDAR